MRRSVNDVAANDDRRLKLGLVRVSAVPPVWAAVKVRPMSESSEVWSVRVAAVNGVSGRKRNRRLVTMAIFVASPQRAEKRTAFAASAAAIVPETTDRP